MKRQGIHLLGCVLWLALGSSLSRADVFVTGDEGCLVADVLKQELAAALQDFAPERENEVSIFVKTETRQAEQTRIVLRIVMSDGSTALARTYDLAPQDCGSANALLLAVVSEFLEELPAQHWAAPPPVEPVPTTGEPVPMTAQGYHVGVSASVLGLVAVDTSRNNDGPMPQAEISGQVRLMGIGKEQEVALGVNLRGSGTHALGSGEFRPTALLVSSSWTLGSRVRYGLEVRGGVLVVRGSGFETNFTRWVPWAEGGLRCGYRWKSFEASAVAFATPLTQLIGLENRAESAVIPRMRVGLGLQYHFEGTGF